jgi:putative tryptophan/tyrosine transport system substrate-binding protein
MRRWQFAAAMGAALVQPLAAFAQEAAPKVVAYLGAQSPEPLAERVRAFVQGLAETGQVEGRDVTIEYRWAHGNSDKLPALASELVRRQPAVIATAGSLAAARAAKAATTSIPIVFEIAAEPVEAGLVKSLTEPNGNLTGVVSLDGGIAALRELTPRAARIGVLINPAGNAAGGWSQAQAAARILGVRLQGLLATNEREFDAAFDTLRRSGAGALAISADPVFTAKSEQLAALTLRHKLPAVHESRRFTAAGGLLSYIGNTLESHRLAGIYAGRLLKGEKPTELPIQTASKGELVINLKTAKALGLDIPEKLLALAAEVIE